MAVVKRGEVYWVNLDPTRGSAYRKTRAGLVISPDDMNQALPRVIFAPLTSAGQPLGCRPEIRFKGKRARSLLDQVRTVDRARLGKCMGEIPLHKWHAVLMEMLA